MILRSVKIDKKFIPEFNDNKKLPAEEQMVIHFSRIPGTSEKSNYKNFNFNQKGDMGLNYNDQMLVSTFVERIENFELEIDGSIKKIVTGSDLAQANNSMLGELFTEIRDYLFPENEEFTEGESLA